MSSSHVLVLLWGAALAGGVEASTIASRVWLPLQSGSTLEARVLAPPPGDGPHPAVMLFAGFDYGADALERVQTSHDTVLASFDYPFEPPEDVDGALDAVRRLPRVRRSIRDTLDGIGSLQAYLETRPDVDPERITLVGVSFGSPFAVVAAERYATPGLAVIHGFGGVTDVVAHALAQRWDVDRRPWVGVVAAIAARVLVIGADVPDVEHHAARLTPGQRVLMLAAQGDERVPEQATRALRSALESSAATLVFEQQAGGHLRGGDDPRVPDLLRRAERWMQDTGLQ